MTCSIPSYEERSEANLADPRIIGSDDLVTDLGSTITDVLLDARDRTLDRLEQEYGDAPIAGVSNFDSITRTSIAGALSDGNIRRESRPIMIDAIERTLDRLGSPVHAPRIERSFGVRDRQQARFFARSTEFAVRDAADDMLDRMRVGVRHGAMRGEEIDVVAERVRDEFDADTIRARSRLIARMEIQNAIQSVKLEAYERHDGIDGVRIINPCTDATTRLCEHLAGCGTRDAAVAWFDVEESMASQLSEHVSEDLMFSGFQPLPPTPPFHFGCRSSIIPALKDE